MIDLDSFIYINKKIDSYSYLINQFINSIANYIAFREYNKKKIIEKGITNIKRKEKIIVSLTTFPSRINTLWICIESLLRQTVKPDEIILWLADTQFDGLTCLPDKLLSQQKRGLTIKFCDDLKAHKKYYYTFKEYPDDIVITADDDVIYPSNLIEELMKLHNKYPDCICCNFLFLITHNKECMLNSTSKWPGIFTRIIDKLSSKLLPVGVSGVLYPPGSVNKEVFNKDVFKKISFYNDDLWLKVMSLLNNTMVVQTNCFPGHFFGIRGTQEDALFNYNIGQNGNDIQFNELLKKYKFKIRC